MIKMQYFVFVLAANLALARPDTIAPSRTADLNGTYWGTELYGDLYHFSIHLFKNNDNTYRDFANRKNCAAYEGSLNLYSRSVLQDPYDVHQSMVLCIDTFLGDKIRDDRGRARFLRVVREASRMYVYEEKLYFLNSEKKIVGVTAVYLPMNFLVSLGKRSWQATNSELIFSTGEIELDGFRSSQMPFTLSIKGCDTDQGVLISYGKGVFIEAPNKRSYETCKQEQKNSIDAFVKSKFTKADRLKTTQDGWILQNANEDLVKFREVVTNFRHLKDTFWTLSPSDRDLYLSIHFLDNLSAGAPDPILGDSTCESYQGSVTTESVSQRPLAFKNRMMVCLNSLSGLKKVERNPFFYLMGRAVDIRAGNNALQFFNTENRVIFQSSPADFVQAHAFKKLAELKKASWWFTHSSGAVYGLQFSDYTSTDAGDAISIPFDLSKSGCSVDIEGLLSSKDGKGVSVELDRGMFYKSCVNHKVVADEVVEDLVGVTRFEAISDRLLFFKEHQSEKALMFLRKK